MIDYLERKREMIRKYELKDKEAIIQILKEGLIPAPSYIHEIEDPQGILNIYEEEDIYGFSLLLPHHKPTKRWNLDLYVVPCARRKGIGTKLYQKAVADLNAIGANTLSVKCRIDEEKNEIFFESLGYKHWFGFYEMVHELPEKQTCQIQFIQYEDQYYEQYAHLISDGFYELRVANDIQPYNCYTASEEGRKNLLKEKENLYLSIDKEGEIISTVYIAQGHIDDLVVNKKYQGQGIGKQTTQFAIQKALEKEAQKIYLDVVIWNEKAKHIYESLGFQVIQTFKFYRQYLER